MWDKEEDPAANLGAQSRKAQGHGIEPTTSIDTNGKCTPCGPVCNFIINWFKLMDHLGSVGPHCAHVGFGGLMQKLIPHVLASSLTKTNKEPRMEGDQCSHAT